MGQNYKSGDMFEHEEHGEVHVMEVVVDGLDLRRAIKVDEMNDSGITWDRHEDAAQGLYLIPQTGSAGDDGYSEAQSR